MTAPQKRSSVEEMVAQGMTSDQIVETLARGPGTVAYARETHWIALSALDDVPWHCLRWWRKHRDIQRRQKLHARAMGWEK